MSQERELSGDSGRLKAVWERHGWKEILKEIAKGEEEGVD